MSDNSLMKEIPSLEALYSVTSEGDIWSHRTQRFLSPYKTSNGYLNIKLVKDGKRHHCQIHRLVALTFIDNPESKREVNHINSDKLDNRLSNLEWVTPKENSEHCMLNNAVEVERRRLNGIKFRKLTFDAAEKIRSMYKTGEYFQRQLARMFDLGSSAIGQILQNKTYKFKEV